MTSGAGVISYWVAFQRKLQAGESGKRLNAEADLQIPREGLESLAGFLRRRGNGVYNFSLGVPTESIVNFLKTM